MIQEQNRSQRRLLPSPLTLQAILALIILLIALTPATSGTALYLPLGPASAARTIAWSQAHGARLLGAGPYQGAFFLHVPGKNLSGAALGNGAVLLSVPEFLCGAPAPEKMATAS